MVPGTCIIDFDLLRQRASSKEGHDWTTPARVGGQLVRNEGKFPIFRRGYP